MTKLPLKYKEIGTKKQIELMEELKQLDISQILDDIIVFNNRFKSVEPLIKEQIGVKVRFVLEQYYNKQYVLHNKNIFTISDVNEFVDWLIEHSFHHYFIPDKLTVVHKVIHIYLLSKINSI